MHCSRVQTISVIPNERVFSSATLVKKKFERFFFFLFFFLLGEYYRNKNGICPRLLLFIHKMRTPRRAAPRQWPVKVVKIMNDDVIARLVTGSTCIGTNYILGNFSRPYMYIYADRGGVKNKTYLRCWPNSRGWFILSWRYIVENFRPQLGEERSWGGLKWGYFWKIRGFSTFLVPPSPLLPEKCCTLDFYT